MLRIGESKMEPDWLVWARRIQALAQTGMAFTRDIYDRERYEALRTLAAEMLAARSSGDPARIETLFAEQSGYATPKVRARGGVRPRRTHPPGTRDSGCRALDPARRLGRRQPVAERVRGA